MNNGDVVFRRIHGRVVPIKRKAEQLNNLSDAKKREAGKGIAIAAAGVGVSFGGGMLAKKYANITHKFMNIANKSVEKNDAFIKAFENKLPNAIQEKLLKSANSYSKAYDLPNVVKRANKAVKFGIAAKYGAFLAGAGLIAYGANKFSKATTKNRQKIKKSVLIGTAGSIALGSVYAGMAGRAGIRAAFVKHALPRIKDFIKATSI